MHSSASGVDAVHAAHLGCMQLCCVCGSSSTCCHCPSLEQNSSSEGWRLIPQKGAGGSPGFGRSRGHLQQGSPHAVMQCPRSPPSMPCPCRAVSLLPRCWQKLSYICALRGSDCCSLLQGSSGLSPPGAATAGDSERAGEHTAGAGHAHHHQVSPFHKDCSVG